MTWLLNGVTAGEVLLNGILALGALAIFFSLWKLHRRNGRYSNFNLVYLIVNKDGYPDGAKCLEMGTWMLMSWGFIVQVTAKSLPEWYVVAFVTTFVGRGAFGAYLRAKGGDVPETPGAKVTTEQQQEPRQ